MKQELQDSVKTTAVSSYHIAMMIEYGHTSPSRHQDVNTIHQIFRNMTLLEANSMPHPDRRHKPTNKGKKIFIKPWRVRFFSHPW